MPDPQPGEMGGDLFAKQAAARPDKDNPGVFPDALNAKPAAPVKKAAKKAKAKAKK